MNVMEIVILFMIHQVELRLIKINEINLCNILLNEKTYILHITYITYYIYINIYMWIYIRKFNRTKYLALFSSNEKYQRMLDRIR